jgi:hypothetical protein
MRKWALSGFSQRAESAPQRHYLPQRITLIPAPENRPGVGQRCRLRAGRRVGQGGDFGQISEFSRGGVTKGLSHTHQGTIVPRCQGLSY